MVVLRTDRRLYATRTSSLNIGQLWLRKNTNVLESNNKKRKKEKIDYTGLLCAAPPPRPVVTTFWLSVSIIVFYIYYLFSPEDLIWAF